MKRILIWLTIMLALLGRAAAEETVWSLETEQGEKITSICYEPEKGDQYISGDNRLYDVVSIEVDRVIVRELGEVTLPDVSWMNDGDIALPVALSDSRRMALYCTHSDESYEPSDGLYSDDERGSIYQIARALGTALEDKGVQTEVADTLHHPHDAGAYRRSRQTAVQLLKSMPDALLDIHRDGIPDPDEYATQIGGKDVSKVRLLVGRGNQNMEANKDFALTVKAVADKVYPGLIKDIYMGKGAFNQDLYPRALLLECGTYTLEKEKVLASMPMMADVLYRTMYGGVTGSAGVSDSRGVRTEKDGGVTQGEPDPPVSEESKGAGSGIIMLVIAVLAGLVIFGIAATGSAKGGIRKAGRNISEMTGGLIGKKPNEDDENKA